jgi:hypothetical protein
MQRGKGGREMSDTDAAEANRRAEWLHKHKAPKDWIVLTTSEVSVIREELLAVEREREAREKLADALQEVDLRTLDFERMRAERNEARHEIEGWRNKWECAVEMAARAEYERDVAACADMVDLLVKDLESRGLGWDIGNQGRLIEARVWDWPYVVGRYRPNEIEPLAKMLSKAMQEVDWQKYPEQSKVLQVKKNKKTKTKQQRQ